MRVFCICLVGLVFAVSAVSASRLNLGIPDASRSQYPKDDSGSFKCLDGSASLTAFQVNDDYCDCKDGSDEPGTSACAYKFHCHNRGHVAETLGSSRVNDGVCDCCDGSDEYAGYADCQDTCSTIAKEKAEADAIKAREREQGLNAKRDRIAKSQQAYSDIEKELATLRKEKEVADQELDAARTEKDAKEKVEQEERNRLIAEWEVRQAELKAKQDAEEAARQAEAQAAGVEAPKEGEEKKEGEEQPQEEQKQEERRPDDYKDEAAEAARRTFGDRENQASHKQSQIQEKEELLKAEYGKDKEFFYLTQRCLEYDAREYTYRLCPYRDVQQIPRHGGGTNMGKYDGWQTTDYGRYGTTDLTVQHYRNGQTCWQGPARSTAVKYVCGEEDKILSVDEPSRCEYTMTATVPPACTV